MCDVPHAVCHVLCVPCAPCRHQAFVDMVRQHTSKQQEQGQQDSGSQQQPQEGGSSEAQPLLAAAGKEAQPLPAAAQPLGRQPNRPLDLPAYGQEFMQREAA